MELHPIKNANKLRFQPGDKSGSFEVVRALGTKHFKRGVAVVYLVRCVCGHETERDRQTLIRPSSGCETCRSKGTMPPGSWSHPLYKRWSHILDRCLNPKNGDYKNYGARGIKVCDRWLTGEDGITGFACFVADMGECPPGHTVERCDNHSHYTPENCRWATRTVQSRNRRSLRQLDWHGRTQPASVWAEEMGIPYFTLMRRLDRGWPVERALTEPVRRP